MNSATPKRPIDTVMRWIIPISIPAVARTSFESREPATITKNVKNFVKTPIQRL